ncbi:MAG: holo-ACP synthase [Caulobacteraceae bacterium]
MIFGIGTDIIEIKRVKKAIARNPKFIERIFTEQEIEYYRKRNMNAEHIAAGFSAKEAVLKALGTGLNRFKWKDIEILRCSIGKPVVHLNGGIKDFVEENSIGIIHVTISHSKDFATATAVAEVLTEREDIVIEDLFFRSDEEIGRNIN